MLIFNKFRVLVRERFDNSQLFLTDPRNIVMTLVSMYCNFIASRIEVGACLRRHVGSNSFELTNLSMSAIVVQSTFI